MRLPFKGLYILTQDFGVNADRYKQFLVLYPDGIRKPMAGHNGLDFGTPHRTELLTPHSGIVKEATMDSDGYGYYVKIENDKEGSVLAHMQSIDVQVGDVLEEGDHIGWSDSTGNSTGAHVHWGYYTLPRDRANGLAGFIDQKSVLENAGITIALGKLPTIKKGTIDARIISNGLESNYKGIDLTNVESVKAAIDAWEDVAHGKYKSVEEYDLLNVQLDTVKKQLEETQKKDENVSSDLKNYNEMKALGYNTINDINKALEDKIITISDLQSEISKVKQRNSTLAGELQKIEEEDHVSIDLSQKAIDENYELKKTLDDITKVLNLDNAKAEAIINSIMIAQEFAKRYIKTIEDKNKAENKPAVKPVVKPNGKSGLRAWITKFASILLPVVVFISLIMWNMRGGVL